MQNQIPSVAMGSRLNPTKSQAHPRDLEGYLAHQDTPPHQTLLYVYVEDPMGVLGGGAGALQARYPCTAKRISDLATWVLPQELLANTGVPRL